LPIHSRIHAPDGLAANPNYSHVIVAHGELAFISGQVAVDATGAVVGAGDIALQTRQVLANVGACLESIGASWADVVKTSWYLRDMRHVRIVRDERDRVLLPALGGKPMPASTLIEVSRLVRDDLLIEMDAICALPTR
jgi:enamine deaminase RidA (YjgF/YER057c/UK114 family)